MEKIGILYKKLIDEPHAVAIYKKIYYYYLNKKMDNEANAFAELIRIKFNEIINDAETNNNNISD